MNYISTEKAPAAIGPYSQAVSTQNLVFVSGQLGLRPDDMEMPACFIEQTRNALNNLSNILEASGSNISKVLKTTIFLTDMSNFSDFNRIYSDFLGEVCPARSCVAVSELPKGGLVEIECIASI